MSLFQKPQGRSIEFIFAYLAVPTVVVWAVWPMVAVRCSYMASNWPSLVSETAKRFFFEQVPFGNSYGHIHVYSVLFQDIIKESHSILFHHVFSRGCKRITFFILFSAFRLSKSPRPSPESIAHRQQQRPTIIRKTKNEKETRRGIAPSGFVYVKRSTVSDMVKYGRHRHRPLIFGSWIAMSIYLCKLCCSSFCLDSCMATLQEEFCRYPSRDLIGE